jgi:hypothetical protein
MIRKHIGSVAALGAFAVLAAGSVGDDFDVSFGDGSVMGGGFSAEANVAACQQHIAHWNNQPCLASAPRDDDFCKAFDNGYADYTEYFSCLNQNTRCNGDLPDLESAANCQVNLGR